MSATFTVSQPHLASNALAPQQSLQAQGVVEAPEEIEARQQETEVKQEQIEARQEHPIIMRTAFKTEKELRRIFGISPDVYEEFKLKYVWPFVEEAIKRTKWLDNKFSAAYDVHNPLFLDFDRKVMQECTFVRDAKLDEETRKRALISAIHRRVETCKATYKKSAIAKQRDHGNAVSKLKSQTRETTSISSTVGHSRANSAIVKDEPRKDSSPAESTITTITSALTTISEEDVSTSRLHLRISRHLGAMNPNLSFQTYLKSLTDSIWTVPEDKIISMLSFDKVLTAARLYLGLDVQEELLAIDHGTSQDKPVFLFIQDDASLRSTIQTWQIQRPKNMIVEVLVVDRPGFIPYRSKADLEKEEETTEDSEADEEEEGRDQGPKDEDEEDDLEEDEEMVE